MFACVYVSHKETEILQDLNLHGSSEFWSAALTIELCRTRRHWSREYNYTSVHVHVQLLLIMTAVLAYNIAVPFICLCALIGYFQPDI